MFEVAELGSSISKDEFEAQLSDLRVDLLNAQFDLRSRDFSMLVVIAGEDRSAVSATTTARTSAETPAVTWTTMPPAKSMIPKSASQPPPQIQWAAGA